MAKKDEKKDKKKDVPFMVIALKEGFYKGRRIHEGDRFMCANEQAFSERWMRRANAKDASVKSEGSGEPDVVMIADMDGAIRDQKIVEVLNSLDRENDDNWTSKGLPNVEVMRGRLDASLTREHITAACPDFVR